MNNEQQAQLLRTQILTALADCAGYMLAEPVLFTQVSIMVAPQPTRAEFTAHLKFLEAENFIVGIHPDLGGPTKWRITDAGKAVIA